jgi:isopentenyldiphosphate isomerase
MPSDPAADRPEERFETFDDDGRPLGLHPRRTVHAHGLWHKSAHVFLFNADGALYVQRRSATKDLFPGRWDFSVGEHLEPRETYLQAAVRGLAEELGVTGVALERLGGVTRWSCRVPELGVFDQELQQAFRGCYDGALVPDPSEVAAVETVTLSRLASWTRRHPDAFTPWFLHELQRLGFAEPG